LTDVIVGATLLTVTKNDVVRVCPSEEAVMVTLCDWTGPSLGTQDHCHEFPLRTTEPRGRPDSPLADREMASPSRSRRETGRGYKLTLVHCRVAGRRPELQW
jgi:hypothetical protein